MSLGINATLAALAALSVYTPSPNATACDDPFASDSKRKFDAANRAQDARGGYFGLRIPDYHSHGDPLPAYDGKHRTTQIAKGQKRLTRAQRKAGKGKSR